MLKTLSCVNGISGFEEAVTQHIIEAAKPYCAKMFKDSFGNLYAFKKGTKGDKTVALCAHTDEVGFMVHNVTENGLIKLLQVGGIDPRVLPGKRVLIGKNKVPGVIGTQAVHLADKKDKGVLPMSALGVDIGAFSKQEALQKVALGDPVYFENLYFETEKALFGKAFDDRAGCALLLQLMQNEYEQNLWFLFTAQEETGVRGAKIASRRMQADEFIVVENTTCLDMPDVPQEKQSTQLGSGPAITIADGASMPNLEMRTLFEKSQVPHQHKNVAAGGNDAGSITANGKKCAAISVPCRYLHTALGVIYKQDFENTFRLIDSYLKGEAQ